MHRQDETRIFRLRLNFLPQANNVRVYRSGRRKAVVPPNVLQQPVASQGFARMVEEVLQQLELFRGEVQSLAFARNLATAQVDLDFAEGKFFAALRDGPRPPENRFDPRQKFANRKRLGDIIIGAEFQSHYFVHFLAARRQHDDGNRGLLGLQLLANVQTAHTRHHDVENYEIRRLAQGPLQAGDTVRCGDHLVAFEFEVVPQPRHHVGLVFDNKDLGHV